MRLLDKTVFGVSDISYLKIIKKEFLGFDGGWVWLPIIRVAEDCVSFIHQSVYEGLRDKTCNSCQLPAYYWVEAYKWCQGEGAYKWGRGRGLQVGSGERGL